jgi:phage baseplate assembly protein W
MALTEKSFLGRGWSFPPAFEKKTASVALVADEADIRESILILLTTRPGERVMEPEYGCALDEMLFEPLTTTLKTYMRDLVRTAVLRYEPRVDLEGVELDDTGELEGRVLITINYRIRATNSRANLVFPFYKNEGQEV